ncbi:hypothetical protein OIY81_2040 [Cryptosporidium canis]|uniref:Guanylate cyclase domain-containing protein n=1 Tax=Cryptosporidium canis TaxID=195482 RepID=A0ABQ8P5I8_9CRYT|nr:hypothetical protein OJ252_2398 [Cryptosporidium canis]KAJ1610520.1 hypothetical protein OIY81_2040 [Cryptosporidium canis]
MGQVPLIAAKSTLFMYSGIRSIVVGNKEKVVPQRPPDLDIIASGERDRISDDWRWLALKSEKRLNSMKKMNSSSEQLKKKLGSTFDINQFSCFVPRTVLEAIADKRISYADDFDVIIESFKGAVMFCDASGFTALTAALDKQLNGAERLGECINNFFTPLIQIIHYWGGDIIKFSGDAICVVWPVDDETVNLNNGGVNIMPDAPVSSNQANSSESSPQLNGTAKDPNISVVKPKVGCDDNSPVTSEKRWNREEQTESEESPTQIHNIADTYSVDMFHACRLACECCMDIHRTLHNFPTPIPGRHLTLHIGVGYGRTTILQVGGVMDRWEYVVGGPPFEEIAVAEPLAKSGETVISPSVHAILGKHVSVDPCERNPDFKKLNSLLLPRPPPPPPLASIHIQDEDVDLLRRYIPPPVYRCLSSGYNVFLNEVRRLTCIFVSVKGLDISTHYGSKTAHQLMQLVQKAAYTMEGSVNKFLVDDKGVLLLIIFGLPPVYHLDDPLRAVFAGLRILDSIRFMGLSSSIGIGTGRVWIGTVGCEIRKEYTALGDTVNLSARLMARAGENEILCDLNTYEACSHAMQFVQKESFYPKGKDVSISTFSPTGILTRSRLQYSNGKTDISNSSDPNLLNNDHLSSGDGISTENQLQTENSNIQNLQSIRTWRSWKPLKKLKKFFKPRYSYGLPDMNDPNFRVIPDYVMESMPESKFLGPLMPWEYYEPWDPILRPTLDLGGVMVIYGKENCGVDEIIQNIVHLGEKLERRVFLCSNMPDTPFINIGNVPLLPWKTLCTDIVESWRLTKSREKKGFSNIDRDNSIYGLAKELTHPSFHWSLHKLKPVLQGLVLPSELSENKAFFKMGKYNSKESKKMKDIFRNPLLFVKNLNGQSDSPDKELAEIENCENSNKEIVKDEIDDDITSSEELSDDDDDDEKGLGPIITSLVNGFSMYENSIICLHVKSGTCFYAGMEQESWKIAKMIARIAMIRRKRKIEHDFRELKRWRRKHSRICLFCKGFKRPIQHISKDTLYLYKTTKCTPPTFKSSPPLLFILICSSNTDSIEEQGEIIQWAKECSAFIEVPKLTLNETSKFIGHQLGVNTPVPFQLVEYVHRASGGIPEHIKRTILQLLSHNAISITMQDDQQVDDPEKKDSIVLDTDKTLNNSDFISNLNMSRNTSVCSNSVTGIDSSIGNHFDIGVISNLISGYNLKNIQGDLGLASSIYTSSDSSSSDSTSSDESKDWSDDSTKRKIKVPRFRTPGPRELLTSDGVPIIGNRCTNLSPGNDQSGAKHRLSLTKLDNSSIVNNHTDDQKRYIKVTGKLRKIPFAPEIVADCMSRLELLEPDEQMAAKIASAFTFAFTASELHEVYPQKKTPQEFLKMIKAMVNKDVFEVCDTINFGTDRSRRGSINSDYTSKHLTLYENDQEKSLNIYEDEVYKDISTSTPILKDISEYLSNVNISDLPKNHKDSLDAIDPCLSEASEIKNDGESNNDQSVNINIILTEDVKSVSDEHDYSKPQNCNILPYYIEYYRFQSVAFQRVVSESLLSDERKRLARISRKTLSRRLSKLSPSVRSASPQLPSSPTDSSSSKFIDNNEINKANRYLSTIQGNLSTSSNCAPANLDVLPEDEK